MSRQLDEIVRDFDSLNISDYDFRLGNYDGQERVRQLCEELMKTPQPERAIPTLFRVFERLPEADFGAPGAIVFTLESFAGYELELVNSIRRKPTPYTVWMVNRWLNYSHQPSPAEEQAAWLSLLHEVLAHSLANEATREATRNFIDFQQERSPA